MIYSKPGLIKDEDSALLVCTQGSGAGGSIVKVSKGVILSGLTADINPDQGAAPLISTLTLTNQTLPDIPIWIVWGDNKVTNSVISGSSTRQYPHTYGASGNYTLQVVGIL